MRPKSRWQLIWLVATGAVVWLAQLGWPVPADSGLDASWQLVLGHARINRLQFGEDLLFNYGPWGYLTTIYCHPECYWPRIAWELVFKTSVVVMLLLVAARLPWWRALLLLVASALFLPYYGDVAYSFFCAGLLWSAVATDRSLRPPAWSIGVVLGFFALQKFTLFLLTVAGVVGASVVLFSQNERRNAMWLATSWVASVISCWIAAGQSLRLLPRFLCGMWELSSAYHEAMFLYESPAMFWAGLACACLFGSIVIATVRRQRTSYRWEPIARSLLGLGIGFLVWKQSVVRADGHMLGFFVFTMLIGLSAPAPAIGTGLATAGLLGVWLTEPSLVTNAHNYLRLHVSDSIAALGSPHVARTRFVAATKNAATQLALPELGARIGHETVDVFGHYQANAVLNGLNFRPRPIFQSYQACSAKLSLMNAAYYESPRAPTYILAQLETVDNRFSALDDARALQLLLSRYVLVGEENDWLLLKRNDRAPQSRSVAGTTEALPLGRSLALPQPSDCDLWVSIELAPSWLGRIRAFLYKPAEAILVLDEGDAIHRYRLTPRASAGGFLLSPILTNTRNLRAALQGAPGPRPRTLAIETAEANRLFFQATAKVTITQQPARRATTP